ncbi:MAG: MarR family winged helix-turn-helix transcriptional regulator [Alphaproteobacteria bacterium]|nr:MarR family winged helix-turn-helix transcriptional regulator [Alphaproteobacteria bacterium]
MSLPSDSTVETWISLVRAHDTALLTVERGLKEAGFPPLAWYDVLLELDRIGPAGLRPFELQAALLLPQYGVSRLIDRIEKAGYLQKQICMEDARGHVLTITDTGRKLRQSMWPVYGAAIEQAVGEKLTPGEMRLLQRVLAKLLSSDT